MARPPVIVRGDCGGGRLLLAAVGYDCEGLGTLIGDILPVLSSYLVGGEELGAHAYAEDAGLHPALDILFSGLYATGDHEFAPGHRCEQTLDEFGAKNVAGEDLAKVTAGLLSCADLAHATTAGSIGNESTVADTGDLGVEQGANHEAGTELDIKSGGGGIYDRAYTHGHLGTLLGGKLNYLGKNFVGEIAAVGELKCTDTTLVASLNYLLGHFGILVIKHGYYAGCAHLGENGDFVKLCHCENINESLLVG